jgi:hypothetical protein
MRYVIIRDDDTNALTPVECLERLYRPFLDRGLPVNLSTIPDVATDTRMANGDLEGYLLKRNGHRDRSLPMAFNRGLVRYLLDNPLYEIVQHGCHHHFMEFDRPDRQGIARLLEKGTDLLMDAGFPRPETFVAPYDRLSSAGLMEVTKHFRVLSTGWFELRRLPYAWWPGYVLKKARRAPHWQMRGTLLLTHPGCLLSYRRTYATMLAGIIQHLNTQRLTVLVTHWWEYFRENRPDEPFIEFLHETAAYLATHPDLKVISFRQLAEGGIPLN